MLLMQYYIYKNHTFVIRLGAYKCNIALIHIAKATKITLQ